ncbi:helix-hairpin-helix domain-containing protein [Providencia stuartii]|uniref:helix-hairpin-helix domain-containing protein n=1 Tax=Providencia stuartii TaxID=588 RepID=UPI0012B6192A|nr:helix-hairpin-helix domain-containing protein [Providencia stuartii]MTB79884.1 helix-hairpin-helix domain-containing protein [Providencia stuartii]HEM6914739.1 helix-hairpin-helix domain-containing protein [Providencia stuartii]HEM7167157.1 helix-hairpin-helix domain-containing protein [Providencia stuartii]
MGFSDADKQCLLAVKGVGPTVISRLEQMGFSTLAQLSEASYEDILIAGAALTGSSCWKNSPQAKKAIEGAIAAAKQAIK